MFFKDKIMDILKGGKEKTHVDKNDLIMFDLPCIIKATTDTTGKRIVELEASNEQVDLEGDVILQKALLDSAASFIKHGHLDIDHISEIGDTLSPPITNKLSYIVGVPLEVTDLGNGRTGVKGLITESKDGISDPVNNKYDELWESLNRKPPVAWRASIFGYPILSELVDCSENTCSHGATRYLVKGIDWRSLAFTRTPMNNKITGFARVVTGKSFAKIMKAGGLWPQEADIFEDGDEPLLSSMVGGTNGVAGIGGSAIANSDDNIPATPVTPNCPANTDEMWGEYIRHISISCPCGDYLIPENSIGYFREHYMVCRGLPFDKSDILAHALAYLVLTNGN